MSRGQNRRLHVPKAGDLYVNGVRTPKGNVHQATKRVISRQDRRQLVEEYSRLAEVQVVKVVMEGARCDQCDEPVERGELAAFEPGVGTYWHMRNEDGVHCRKVWLEQHTDTTG